MNMKFFEFVKKIEMLKKQKNAQKFPLTFQF